MVKLGAFALIFDEDGAILLAHRRDMDVWDLPGGGAETGEAPWDAAVRETREEVGLTVGVDHLAGVYWKPGQNEIVFTFICPIEGGELAGSDETDDMRFFPVDNLPRNLGTKHRERIHDAVSGQQKPVLREQTGPGTRQLVEQGLL